MTCPVKFEDIYRIEEGGCLIMDLTTGSEEGHRARTGPRLDTELKPVEEQDSISVDKDSDGIWAAKKSFVTLNSYLSWQGQKCFSIACLY